MATPDHRRCAFACPKSRIPNPGLHCMNQPWLTTRLCPVSALVSKAASVSATLATSSTVVNSPSTVRSEEHTSELQSLMRNPYAVFCLKTQKYPPPRSNQQLSPTDKT